MCSSWWQSEKLVQTGTPGGGDPLGEIVHLPFLRCTPGAHTLPCMSWASRCGHLHSGVPLLGTQPSLQATSQLQQQQAPFHHDLKGFHIWVMESSGLHTPGKTPTLQLKRLNHGQSWVSV